VGLDKIYFLLKTCLIFASFVLIVGMAHVIMKHTLLHLPLSIWNLVI
jgi:hypothetical protein